MRVIDRIVSAVGRRVDDCRGWSTRAAEADGSRVNALFRRWRWTPDRLDRRFPAERLGEDLGCCARATGDARLLSHCARARSTPHQRGHRLGKDDAQRAVELHLRKRTHRDHRGRRGTAAAQDVVPGTRPPNGRKARFASASSSSTRLYALIASSSASAVKALDMQAMNTGHDGSLTTVHANTPRDALRMHRNDDRDGRCQPAERR